MINYTQQEERYRKDPSYQNRGSNNGALWVGILLILAGILLVLQYAGILSWQWRHLIFSWQMLLIAIGIVQVCRRSQTSGFILMAIGGFFLLPRIGTVLHIDIFSNIARNFWPVVLIVVGLIFVISHSASRSAGRPYTAKPGEMGHRYTSGNGTIRESFIFNGGELTFLDPVFYGGRIDATFGGCSLDLRRTSLPTGTTRLKINCTFGGITLFIPETWTVITERNAVMGGINDHRIFSENCHQDPERCLVLEIQATFGGVDIKN